MGQVSSVEDTEEIDALAAPMPQNTEEPSISSALEAIQELARSGDRDSTSVSLQDLFSGATPSSLSDKITDANLLNPKKVSGLFQDHMGGAPASNNRDSDLEGALLNLVPSVESAHNRKIEDFIAQIDEMQKNCDKILETRKHLNRAKDGELELTQELFDLLLSLEDVDCGILDETTKQAFLKADEPFMLNAETIAEMKTLASAHSDRVKSMMSRHYSTKLQPAFSELQSILESLKKMLESLSRFHDRTVNNQIAR